MIAAIVRRLLFTLLTLFGLSVLVFVLVRLIPGDTAEILLGLNYTPEAAERLRQEYGLDRSWPEQYVVWLGHFLTGNWGQSASGEPVASRMAQAAPVTIQLASMAALLAACIGVPLGMLATRPGRLGQALVFLVSLVGLSIPSFWLGTLLILGFSLRLHWLPSGGWVPWWQDPWGSFAHMLMPSVALGLAVAAVLARMTYAALGEVVQSDYIRTARGKGLSPSRVIGKHALRNALPPILTIAGLQVGYLLGGSVVIVEFFNLPGMGRLVLTALGERDYPLLQACLLTIGGSFVLVNLLVDVLNAWANPQLRGDFG